MSVKPNFGAFVISLDFELHWGVRDIFAPSHAYRANILGVRQAVPALLDLFEEFGIAATWATVGFLFANSKDDFERFKPAVLPVYEKQKLFPYDEPIGANETDDLLHYAPGLIRQIQTRAKQEIGTHTYSHYYCLEAGQTAETFAADLASARRIAENSGVELRSIVFPRNQFNPAYEQILIDNRIECYRGNQTAWMYQISEKNQTHPVYRAARLVDAHANLAGSHTAKWADVWKTRVANVPASFFLRPVSKNAALEKLRQRRLINSLTAAAKQREIFHLWWHPHNFGVNLHANIEFLRQILIAFKRLQNDYEMRSLSMLETAQIANAFSTHTRAATTISN